MTEDYAQTMLDGEWKAGSVLIFSENYKIIDGYYRLAAVASVRSARGILSCQGSASQSVIPVAPSTQKWMGPLFTRSAIVKLRYQSGLGRPQAHYRRELKKGRRK